MIFIVAFLVLLENVVAAPSVAEQQAFLDSHNRFRAALARGQVGTQPPAADMTLLDYDTEIEAKAEVWNNKCKAGHDGSQDRLVNKPDYAVFTYIGQNWAGFSGPVTGACDMWWNEYKDYGFDSNRSINGRITGHYTQMAWSKTTVIGCAVKPACSRYGQHVTCNYATGGNFNNQKPYIKGPACSQCPDGYNFCIGDALCARRDQCGTSSCKCAVTNCNNGGTLDSQNCLCKCSGTFYGDRCQYECKDTNQSCRYNINCNEAYWKENCKAKCNQCQSSKPFISKSRGSTVSRI